MLFGLEADTGDQVAFYIVPNSFSETPAIRVVAGGEERLVMSANEVRDAVVVAKRHETGQCGFRIDSTMIPGLADMHDLTVTDKETDVLIYRRPMPGHIQKKILRIEPSFLPMFDFDKPLMDRFQYSGRYLEMLGHETVTQLLLLQQIKSVYLSGRILYKNYAYFIEDGFKTIFFLDDPYLTLAERILVLARLHNSSKMHFLSERDALLLKSAAEFAASLQINDGRALRRSLRSVPQEVAIAIVNPVTRLLTATAPDEMPRRGSLAGAFDILASSAVVGIRHDVDLFIESVAAYLELDPKEITVPQSTPGVIELARLLREEAQVEQLIETDLAIYNQIVSANEAMLSEAG